YAQATGLWRSSDAGESWKLVYPDPRNIEDIVMRSDHSDESLVTNGDSLGILSALAIDPEDSRILYAAGDKSHTALFISRDWGKPWSTVGALPETPQRIWVDPKSPHDARVLYIAGQHSVSVLSGSGLRNFPSPQSVTFTDISAGFTSAPKPIVYGVSDKG